ncbi:MAG: DUF1674 domain-containing protein [Alphaproteobacteria bacterium]|nr:DUF1674 domain-containing protein [Alphaproteobacteria bacterium]MDE2042984.1 DUF1674 domain-containing protein [Alphaproteobacteria bacterium]MDE2341207.1 DUF1674 domain-containing protein [Alphaproteobacteria bacterium]
MKQKPPTKRPDWLKAPAHLSASPPVPVPAEGRKLPDKLDPTRYGDWVKKGIAIDF